MLIYRLMATLLCNIALSLVELDAVSLEVETFIHWYFPLITISHAVKIATHPPRDSITHPIAGPNYVLTCVWSIGRVLRFKGFRWNLIGSGPSNSTVVGRNDQLNLQFVGFLYSESLFSVPPKLGFLYTDTTVPEDDVFLCLSDVCFVVISSRKHLFILLCVLSYRYQILKVFKYLVRRTAACALCYFWWYRRTRLVDPSI